MRRLAFPMLLLLAASALVAASPAVLGPVLEEQRARVAAEPGNVAALNDLGNLLLLAGDRAGAEAAYRHAVDLDPGFAAAHFNLGLLLQEEGARFGAYRAFRATLKADPTHAWARYQLGTIYSGWRLKSLATRSYARAIAAEPRLADPRFNPNMIENRLATEAMLTASTRYGSETSAPRAYAERERLARALVGAKPAAEPTETLPRAEAQPLPAAQAAPERPPERAAPSLRGATFASEDDPVAAAAEERKPGQELEGGYLEVRVLDESGLEPGTFSGQVVVPGGVA
ncbi:MAG TPA: hypothetical protein VLA75_06015, partial [Thermoanaerobaculia bacterium]|nr:hypothetical protein [Thermoanaerobaculia bacterium]